MDNNDISKQILENLNRLPTILKYPALLALCEALTKLLPQVKREYDNEAQVIFERFLEIVSRSDNEEARK